MSSNLLFICISVLLIAGCASHVETNLSSVSPQLELKHAVAKMEKHLSVLAVDSLKIPRALEADGSLISGNSRQWTSGFFPGTLWQLYSFSKNKDILESAKIWTAFIEKEKWDTHTHDLGFKVNSSFGKAYAITGNEEYKDVVIQASKTLIKRYNDKIGSIRSWDWNADVWEFPVIVDNMMNLEMLFDATKFTGDSIYYKVAYQHALTTLENQFRADHSSYHVIDYDTSSHQVRLKTTHQGYNDESAWARGQAWGLHGFVTCYARTGDESFLKQANLIADYIFNHPNLPKDLIPYWDYNAPAIPNEPRDVSAATVTASALIDLATFVPEKKSQYLKWVDQILVSLSEEKYKSEVVPFLLDHSTGSVPGKFEVDVPITYADFYYVETLLKRNQTLKEL